MRPSRKVAKACGADASYIVGVVRRGYRKKLKSSESLALEPVWAQCGSSQTSGMKIETRMTPRAQVCCEGLFERSRFSIDAALKGTPDLGKL